MELRTDLALEIRQQHPRCSGVTVTEERHGGTSVSVLEIETPEAAREMGRAVGRYITLSLPPLTDSAFLPEEHCRCLSRQLSAMLPGEGTVLVAGLGNLSVTPDALGPKTVSMIPATRHVVEELKRVTGGCVFRPCAVLAPGVLGQTGVEAAELIASVCSRIKPAAVVVIDALASRGTDRLGCTVQLTDTGIHPGSGVGNCRPAVSQAQLGVPVVAVGVPTVVDAATLATDLLGGTVDSLQPGGRGMIVTPREIDLLIDRAARMLAMAINHALHPNVDPEELMTL